MNKDQFHRIETGDWVEYFGTRHQVVEVERWTVSPGVKETSSATMDNGDRVKEDDASIADITVEPKELTYIVHEDNLVRGRTMQMITARDDDELARKLTTWDTYDGDETPRPYIMADLARENDGEVVYTIYEWQKDGTMRKVLA